MTVAEIAAETHHGGESAKTRRKGSDVSWTWQAGREKGVGDPSYSKSAVDRRKKRLVIRQRTLGGGIGEQTENVRGKGKRSGEGEGTYERGQNGGPVADRDCFSD